MGGSGQLTQEELQQHLDSPIVRARLAAIDMEVYEARGLFGLLDLSENGCISIDEFVIGCMRLKGGAKQIDLATLMCENKRLGRQLVKLEHNVRDMSLDVRRLFQVLLSCQMGGPDWFEAEAL